MNSPRFSLARLMIAVIVVAVALASIVTTSDVWSTAAFSAVILALIISILGIVYSQSSARAFWVGFALVGWSYVILEHGPWFSVHVRPNLLSSGLADYLHPKLQRTQTGLMSTTPLGGLGGGGLGVEGGSVGVSGMGDNSMSGGGMSGGGMGGGGIGGGMGGGMIGQGGVVTYAFTVGPSYDAVWRTCDSALTVLLAWAGGLAGRYFYAHRRKELPD